MNPPAPPLPLPPHPPSSPPPPLSHLSSAPHLSLSFSRQSLFAFCLLDSPPALAARGAWTGREECERDAGTGERGR
eukprot:188279-Rhodomonas_salina.1